MSFYDDASLVVIPSGYKTSKVYAEKPTDGSGDLAFTRTGDTATRVNSAGLIEKVRTNLVLQSNTFSTTWVNSDSNETSGQAGYDGTNNAWRLTTTISGGFIYQSVAINGLTTFSIYAKAGTQNGIILYSAHVAQGINFNLSTGVVGAAFVAAPSGSLIESIGNGWYRCSITVSSSSTNVFRIYVSDGSNTSLGNVLIQNAQVEAGDVATAYIPTTTAAVSVGPVANVPRLDYLGSSCPRLLLEGQRSNLVTFSEQLNNAAWISAGGTVTSNTATSPDGYQNADTLTGARYQTGFASNQYTVSCFAKKVDGDGLFVLRLDVPTSFSAQFNLNNGTIVSTSAGYTSTITNYGNGWYRCTLTTPVSTTISNFVLVSASVSAASTYVWGAQCEVGAYATSYIPTLAASATRGADAASKTGISSLIGQTEGVAFIDFVWNGLTGVGSYPRIIELATDSNNIIQLYSIAGTTTWGWDIINGGVVQFTGSSTMALGRNKIAVGYKLNDMVIYKNGTLVASDATCTVPATSALGVTGIFNGTAGAQLAASVNQVLLFKTRLTNAEMAELTTI